MLASDVTVPVLYTASFYAPNDWVGSIFRVSRGHPRGRRTQWGNLPFLYPPLDLFRDYRSGRVGFETLTTEYLRGLDALVGRSDQFREWLEGVPELGRFTLLCFEPAGENCHRRVLADWLLERVRSLELGAKR